MFIHNEQELSRLLKFKNPRLDLPEGLISPDFEGFSLLNLPSTLSNLLACPPLEHKSLQLPFLTSLKEPVDQVILCLLDGLSYSRFLTWMESCPPFVERFREGFLSPITSIVPATTCAALTSLWTGRSPAEHAILGYELFLREYGITANMITHSPMSMTKRHGLLYEAGFSPELAQPFATLGEIFNRHRVSTLAFLPRGIKNSGLSRMHYPFAEKYGYVSLTDLWITLRNVLEEPAPDRRFIWCYYGGIDNMSHHHSPDSEYSRLEFNEFISTLNRYFLEEINPDFQMRTLFLLSADHGQIVTPRNPDYELKNHPELLNMLHFAPTGENRLAFLHVKPGHSSAVIDYFDQTWPDDFFLLDSREAIDSGLFGPGKPHDAAYSRIGDLTVISLGNSYLWWTKRTDPLKGRHGGLTEDEMIIPMAGFFL